MAAYKAAKRTNGNASVSLQDIKTMPADYTGSSILGGGNNRRYEMSAVVPSGRPLKFENVTKFTDYAGKNPISKVVG